MRLLFTIPLRDRLNLGSLFANTLIPHLAKDGLSDYLSLLDLLLTQAGSVTLQHLLEQNVINREALGQGNHAPDDAETGNQTGR